MVFNFSAITLINILLIAGGIGICGLCFLQITDSSNLQKEVRRYFQCLFLLILVYISCHLARELMNGLDGSFARVVLYAVTLVEVASVGLMAYLMSFLVVAVSKPEERFAKPLKIIFDSLLGLHVVLLIIFTATRGIFYFDGINTYHRGGAYLLSNLCPFAMLVIDIVLLIRHRQTIDRAVKSALWVFIVAPIAAAVIQIFFFNIQYIIFATVAASVYVFSVFVKTQNDDYVKEKTENIRIGTDLLMASNIQNAMLPNIFPAYPERPEFDIYASMTPAKVVGGDFFDFYLIDDDHLCMVMADVSGKGVPASLFWMSTKIILQGCAMQSLSPAEILTRANETISANNPETMFVTTWIGVLDLNTGLLKAANAGHEYPVIKNPDGPFTVYKDQHGFVLGGMSGVKYKEYEIRMSRGSKLFLYTDGVPEATNTEEVQFGMDRLQAALNEHAESSPEQLLYNVRQAVNDFVKDAEQFDDLTMLCLEYRGKN